jgi:hypothetical protein
MVGKRSFARRRAGVQFVVNAMLETADFFEAQIKQCRDSAAQSTNKNDREFWLKMAARRVCLKPDKMAISRSADRPGLGARCLGARCC